MEGEWALPLRRTSIRPLDFGESFQTAAKYDIIHNRSGLGVQSMI